MAKIVVIEDEASVSTNLVFMLKFENHEVLSAPDGEAGLELVRATLPDLILCDVNMPKLDGHGVLAELQKMPETVDIPFIFLTANAEKSDFRHGMTAGASDYLTKPFTRDDLLQAVDAQLRKHRIQHEAQNEAAAKMVASSGRMRYELDKAQSLLATFIDGKIASDGRLRYLSRPKEIASGDILLARQMPDGGLLVLLGDATGHGLIAAVATLPAAAVFETAVTAGMPLPQILAAVNTSLRSHLGGSMFIAAALVEFNPQRNLLTAWNGGMPEILLFDAQGAAMGMVKSDNLALGLSDDEMSFSHFDCAPGCRAYLFSDGLSECENPQGEPFGVQRLQEAIARHFHSEDRIARITAEMEAHCAGRVPHDDITLAEVILR